MSRRNCTLLFFLLSVVCGTPALAGVPVRVAIQDFTPTRDSYWAGRDAAAMTAAVQAMLPAQEDIEWVERSELETAMRELALSQWAVDDDASRLRIGHWLRADFMVGGEMIPSEEEGARLVLEVIEVGRADLIVERQLEFDEPANRLSTAELAAIAETLSEMIAEAREIVESDRGRPVIAPIAFLNSDSSRRLDHWEPKIGKIWREAAREGKRVRVLNLSRPRDVEAERRLSLLGLTETADDSWQKVADVYVWGEYEEVEYADRAFEDVVIAFRLHLWSGTDDLATIEKRGRVGDFEQLARELGEKVFQRARMARTASSEAAGRAAMRLDEQARRIVERASPRPNAQLPERQRQALYSYRRTLFELGRFLDPANSDRQWKLATMRAGRGREPFHIAARRAAEMLDWCREHIRDLGETRSQTRLRTALTSWAALSPMLDVDARGRSGIAADTPPPVLAEWRREIEERLVVEVEQWSPIRQEMRSNRPLVFDIVKTVDSLRDAPLRLRLLQAAEEDYRAAVEWVMEDAPSRPGHSSRFRMDWIERSQVSVLRVFMDLGRPKEGVEWLGLDLDETAETTGRNDLVEEVGAAPETDPASIVFALNPDRPAPPWEKWRNLRPATYHVNEIETRPLAEVTRWPIGPATQSVPYHRTADIEYDRIVAPASHVWLAARRIHVNHRSQFLTRFQNQPRAVRTEHLVFRYDRRSGEFEEVSPDEEIADEITGMLLYGDDLWLTTAGDGAWRREGQTGEWSRFRASDGLIADNLRGIARVGDRLAFLADGSLNRLIGYYDPVSGTWMRQDFTGAAGMRGVARIVSSGDWLLLLGSVPHLLHVPSGELVDLTGALQDIFGDGVPRGDAVSSEGGFWLMTHHGTFFLTPGDPPEIRKVHAYRGGGRVAAADGNFLWIARDYGMPRNRNEAGGRLYLLNKEWPEWMGSIALPDAPIAIEASTESLWLGFSRPIAPLWEYRKPRAMRASRRNIESRETSLADESLHPLIVAAASGAVGEIDSILNEGELPDLREMGDTTPLLAAVINGREEAVARLLAAGADPDFAPGGSDVPAPLFAAAERDHVGIVRQLLEAGALVDSRRNGEITPLIAAARAGAVESMRLLCDEGANVDARDKEGWGPIHHAAFQRHGRAVELLLECGADPNLPALNGNYTALRLALVTRGLEIATFLLAHGAEGDESTLSQAVDSGNADLVSALLERGAPVNSRRFSPFRRAVSSGDRDIIQAFFDHGFNPSFRNMREEPIGGSALARAVDRDELWVVRELLDRGLDPNHRSVNGRALERAVTSENLEAVRLLLDAGADPLLPGRSGERIIDMAAEGAIRTLMEKSRPKEEETVVASEEKEEPERPGSRHQPRPLEFLLGEGLARGFDDIALKALRAGANPDTMTVDRWPVIVLAAASEDPLLVKELVARGADVNATVEWNGISALGQAAVRNNIEVARVLLEQNALFGFGNRGKDAIELATERNHAEILNLFQTAPGRNHANNSVTTAIYSRSIDDLREAIQKSPDISQPDADLRTPLALAIEHLWHGRPAVPLLIEYGADVNRRDPGAGAPPLLIAMETGLPDIVKLLLEHGADLSATDEEGKGVAEYIDKIRHRNVRTSIQQIIDERGQASGEASHETGRVHGN